MSNKATSQYLQRYAETETTLLDDWPVSYHYQHVLLIPAYKETPAFLHDMLNARWFNDGVLLILIINQPDSDHDLTPQQSLYDAACQCGETRWQKKNLRLLTPQNRDSTQNRGHLLIADRFHHPLPEKQGVGLARKIGADLALALIQRGIVQSEWIGSTDADANLPDDYFMALAAVPPDAVAACYDFTHVSTESVDNNNAEGNKSEITAATLTYEQAMRYYVAGLRYAGSPYAHFTIGSIMAFKASAYAQVRGFPKRAAGEDFYLLNKLVKLGAVARVKTTIQLQARLSDRVPFGTGVSTANIIQLEHAGQAFCYYHPQVFKDLRAVLAHFAQLWDKINETTDEQWLDELPTHSVQALLALGFSTTIEKLQHQCRTQHQFNHQLTGWFDGLKTLQFIHILRDSTYPNLPLTQAIQRAVFIS